MKRLPLRLFAAIIALLTVFSFSACSASASHTYWNIVKKKAAGDFLEYYAMIYVDGVSNDNKIDEIWVNVSGFGEKEVTICLEFSSSSSPSSYYNRQIKTIDRMIASDAEGWVRLCEGIQVSRAYCLVTLSDTVHFNEIVFLAGDKSKFETNMVTAGERNSKNSSIKLEYDLNEASSAEAGSEKSQLADKIVDEPDWFDYETACALYEKAIIRNAPKS